MNRLSIQELQIRLRNEGFYPNPVDGIWDRKTIAAVKAFQQSKNLLVDGIVGPQTAQALDSNITSSSLPLPWLNEALRLVGTREVLGSRNNPVILDWADDLDLHYSGDDIPWCGLFVAHCISSTLTEEVLPENPLGARQWATFGNPTTPRVGAIVVFWRDSPTASTGHVGFYIGENNDSYRILGGNQQNTVCITWINRDRFLTARWPQTAASLLAVADTLSIDKASDLANGTADQLQQSVIV